VNIINELDVDAKTHDAIAALRNLSFPGYEVDRSYYKQLPHYRCLQYDGETIIGYMGLDYRAIRVGETAFKTLGVIDLCIAQSKRGHGLATEMLEALTELAKAKDVDFIMLMSSNQNLYAKNGFQRIETQAQWLKIHEHQNLGIADDFLDDLYVKATGSKQWPTEPMDWLGYMY